MTTQELLEEELKLEEGLEGEVRAGEEHGEIGVQMARHLANYVYPKRLGRVTGAQTTYLVGGKPPKRQPDVAFVTLERVPHRIEGDVPFAPDLAVEVISPTDAGSDIDKKTLQYQQAGVRLIWVVRPVLQIVEVYRLYAGFVPQIVSLDQELDGEEVIPGFKLKVSALFEY